MRLRAEIEFLEHDKELCRLQLLKEVSIADAEEKAFKRLLDEEQTSNEESCMGSQYLLKIKTLKSGVYHDNLNFFFH